MTRPTRPPRRARAQWLVTVTGLLAVRVCGLCGALVVRDGAAQHDRHHRVGGAR